MIERPAPLEWKRIPDGFHNNRPMYEYEAVDNGIRYHIYRAIDRGGFGLSISYATRSGVPDDLKMSGIMWLRALSRCKAYAENDRAIRAAQKDENKVKERG